MATYWLDEHYNVDSDAIYRLPIETEDAAAEGYLIDHGNRHIACAVGAVSGMYDHSEQPAGWLVWIETNADPILLDDDLTHEIERLTDVCRVMSDAPDHDLQTGLDRLRSIAENLPADCQGESREYWQGWCDALPETLEEEECECDEISALDARGLLEEAASHLTGEARESYEGSGKDMKNEAVIEIQRGRDPREVVEQMFA